MPGFSSLVRLFRNDLAMDLGTANSLVHLPGAGVVLNEPSVAAVDAKSGKIIALGREAKAIMGKTPQGVKTIRPMKDGVIADFKIVQAMIAAFLRQAMGSPRGFSPRSRPRIVVSTPTGVTQVEKRAVVEAAESAGAKIVHLIEEPMAAALGAGLDVAEASGKMVVDVGGGTTDVAVISLSAFACAESVRVAGDELDEAVMKRLLESKGLVLGENAAERVKIELGSAWPGPLRRELDVVGKDAKTGAPVTVRIDDAEIREALQEPLGHILACVLRALERTPPELSTDLAKNGVLLTGGGALLPGLDVLVAKASGLPVRVEQDPLTTVVRGAGKTLENIKLWRSVFIR